MHFASMCEHLKKENLFICSMKFIEFFKLKYKELQQAANIHVVGDEHNLSSQNKYKTFSSEN